MAGTQAVKFALEKTRATKDVDVLLNALALRDEPVQVAQVFAISVERPCGGYPARTLG